MEELEHSIENLSCRNGSNNFVKRRSAPVGPSSLKQNLLRYRTMGLRCNRCVRASSRSSIPMAYFPTCNLGSVIRYRALLQESIVKVPPAGGCEAIVMSTDRYLADKISAYPPATPTRRGTDCFHFQWDNQSNLRRRSGAQ